MSVLGAVDAPVTLWEETVAAGYKTIVPNLTMNLSFAAMWWAMWLGCHYLTPVLAPKFAKQLKSKDTRAGNSLRYFNAVFVATVHAVWASIACLVILANPDPVLVDGVYGSTPGTTLIFQISTGYFIFDLLMCIAEGWGLEFTIHGLMCTIVYSTVQYPFLHYYGLSFLLYELSTPFFHTRWVLIKMDMGTGALYNFVQYGFAAAFFVVRILVGWPMSLMYLWPDIVDLLRSGHAHSVVFTLFILTANVVLNLLNGWWFSNILLVALGRDSKSLRRKAKEAKKDDKKD